MIGYIIRRKGNGTRIKVGSIDDKLEIGTEELVFVSIILSFLFFFPCFILLSGNVYE